MKLCRACQQAPVVPFKPGPLAFAKVQYCAACRAERRKRPPSGVTAEQAKQLASMLGQMPRREIQQRLGLSKSAITRWLREQGWRVKQWNAYDAATVEAVCQAYAEGGRRLVRERFPGVKVRSIVERYCRKHGYRPRQIRWTDEQLVEAVRMAGLVSHTAQARYFGRPNAYEGSIRHLWQIRFRLDPRLIHGIPAWLGTWPGLGVRPC